MRRRLQANHSSFHITGYRHQGFYGKSYTPSDRIGMDGILHRVSVVVKGEKDVMMNRFRQYNITHIYGTASFTGDEHAVQVSPPVGDRRKGICGDGLV